MHRVPTMRPDDRMDRIVDEFGRETPATAARGRRDSGPRAAVPVPSPAVAADPSIDLLQAFSAATRGLDVTAPQPPSSVDLLEALKEAATAVAEFPARPGGASKDGTLDIDTGR